MPRVREQESERASDTEREGGGGERELERGRVGEKDRGANSTLGPASKKLDREKERKKEIGRG